MGGKGKECLWQARNEMKKKRRERWSGKKRSKGREREKGEYLNMKWSVKEG